MGSWKKQEGVWGGRESPPKVQEIPKDIAHENAMSKQRESEPKVSIDAGQTAVERVPGSQTEY